MHLYKISRCDDYPVHVVARTTDEAAELFITWRFSLGRDDESFTVECLPLDKLNPEQRKQVRSAFAANLVGIAHFDQHIGWTFSPPLWQPLGDDEMSPQTSDGGVK